MLHRRRAGADLLLGRENADIDLVVSGGGISFAEEIAAQWGGRVVVFGDFDTAKVLLPDGWSIDVARPQGVLPSAGGPPAGCRGGPARRSYGGGTSPSML